MQHPTNPTYHARDPCQPQNIFHIPQSRAGNNPEQIADTSKICGEKERSSLTQHKVVCMSPAYVAKTLGELGQMTRTTVLQMKWSSCLGQSRSFTGSYVQLPTAPSRAEPHCRGRSRLQTVEILICIQALGMKEGGGAGGRVDKPSVILIRTAFPIQLTSQAAPIPHPSELLSSLNPGGTATLWDWHPWHHRGQRRSSSV